MAELFSHPLDGKFVARLKNNIEGHVHFDPYTAGRYSTDASIYQVAPFGVVIPKTIQDLVAAVEIAADYNIPILPLNRLERLANEGANSRLKRGYQI